MKRITHLLNQIVPRRNRLTVAMLLPLVLIPIVSAASSDTTELSYSSFMAMVKEHHPLAKQANLQIEKGAAIGLVSRGNFDPSLQGRLNQKYYDGNNYYSVLNAGVKIPTWFGIEVATGYLNNTGYQLNPENTLPESGIFYASVSVPLGKDLFIDKRMAEMKKAEVYATTSTWQRELMLNNLFYEAGTAYWNWFLAYNQWVVLRNAYELAEDRFLAVKRSSELGDRAALDTLEASIQMQNRWLQKSQAEILYYNATADLSVYLWYDGLIPLEPSDDLHPSNHQLVQAVPVDADLLPTLDSLIAVHPEMELYKAKLGLLAIEQRYNREQFKPQVDLKYEALSAPFNSEPLANYSISNYSWGLEVAFPVALRQERGNAQLTAIAMEETNYQRELKREQLRQKVEASINELTTSQQQFTLYQQTVNHYVALLNGENTLFSTGESSLFMVNARETDAINSQLKLIEILHKNRKAKLSLAYALGILNSEL